jgi:hypothetical protein
VRKAAHSGTPCVMGKSEFILGVILSGVGTYIAAAVVLSHRTGAIQGRAQLWRRGKLT